jgi:hypothetical protein
MKQKDIHDYFSKLGKKARKVHPYPKEHYQKMHEKGMATIRARKAKISIPIP